MKKTVLAILFVCLSMQLFFGQEYLKLNLKIDTDKTVNETEHFYLMEIINNGNSTAKFNINIDNTACQYIENNKQVDLIQSVLSKNKSQVNNQFSIKSGESIEFYVKISRPKDIKRNTWNCSEIKAKSLTGESLSNSVIIKSLIPDPEKFN